MTNIEQFFYICVQKKLIPINKKEQLLEFFNKSYPNSDLYKDKLSFNILNEIFTFAEAQELYNLSQSTLHKNIDYNRYLPGEIKQSSGTWLITKDAMERLYPSHIKYSKRFYSFLLYATENELITIEEQNDILDLFIIECPNMDIYSPKSLDLLRVYNSYDNFFLINEVMTFSEVAEIYNISKSTLRKNVDKGKYLKGEIRQSKSTWLITRTAVKRLYDKFKGE